MNECRHNYVRTYRAGDKNGWQECMLCTATRSITLASGKREYGKWEPPKARTIIADDLEADRPVDPGQRQKLRDFTDQWMRSLGPDDRLGVHGPVKLPRLVNAILRSRGFHPPDDLDDSPLGRAKAQLSKLSTLSVHADNMPWTVNANIDATECAIRDRLSEKRGLFPSDHNYIAAACNWTPDLIDLAKKVVIVAETMRDMGDPWGDVLLDAVMAALGEDL